MGLCSKSPTKAPKTTNNSTTKSNNGISFGDDPSDVWKATRAACTIAVMKVFQSFSNKETLKKEIIETKTIEKQEEPSDFARKYELMLYKKHSNSLTNYKLRFRKDLTALKSSKTEFGKDIFFGNLTMEEFVEFDDKELLSVKQKLKDKELLNAELKNSLGQQFPTNINQIKNQNLTLPDQWWASGSSAKLDTNFDLE